MTVRELAKSCVGAIFRNPPRAPDPDLTGYDPSWEARSVKELLFVVNCMLLPHQRFPSYDDLIHKIKGTRQATDEQAAAATAVLRRRAGAMYDLTNALSAMHRRWIVEVAENTRLERILSSRGWLIHRNFWWAAALIAVTVWVGLVGRPTLMIVAKDVRYDAIVERIANVYAENARLRVENRVLQQYLQDATAENEEIKGLLKKYVGEE
ncbi:short coiled-coil protein [Candidatus Pacearchaeota archaeon]|jgi:hypothetical protein|nr:short coiled-coil protein [Candidatus Pacearchaeota archaeon]